MHLSDAPVMQWVMQWVVWKGCSGWGLSAVVGGAMVGGRCGG